MPDERLVIEPFEEIGRSVVGRAASSQTCQACYTDGYFNNRNGSNTELTIIIAAVAGQEAAERVKLFFKHNFQGDPPIPVDILEPDEADSRWRVRVGYCSHCRRCLTWLLSEVKRTGGITRKIGHDAQYHFQSSDELRQALRGACEIGGGLLNQQRQG
jgi:hypothetical protein